MVGQLRLVETYTRSLWVPQIVLYSGNWMAVCTQCGWLGGAFKDEQTTAIYDAMMHIEQAHDVEFPQIGKVRSIVQGELKRIIDWTASQNPRP